MGQEWNSSAARYGGAAWVKEHAGVRDTRPLSTVTRTTAPRPSDGASMRMGGRTLTRLCVAWLLGGDSGATIRGPANVERDAWHSISTSCSSGRGHRIDVDSKRCGYKLVDLGLHDAPAAPWQICDTTAAWCGRRRHRRPSPRGDRRFAVADGRILVWLKITMPWNCRWQARSFYVTSTRLLSLGTLATSLPPTTVVLANVGPWGLVDREVRKPRHRTTSGCFHS